MSKKPKLTPWFPPSVKPVHVGVYEVQPGGWFARWQSALAQPTAQAVEQDYNKWKIASTAAYGEYPDDIAFAAWQAALAQPTAQAVDPQRQALKTCPFCDGAARFGKCVPGEQDMANDGAEYVECEACGASTCLVFPCMDDVKQSLRERWNRRAALASRRDSGAGGVGGSARVAQAH